MKKGFYVVFIALFLLICAAPILGMAVFGPSASSANEILANAPAAREEDGMVNMSYLTELADFVADRFWLRQELISLGRRVDSTVFGVSSEDDVILGRDGWLFFTSTLDDYTGVRGLTDRELWSAARNLALMAEYCEDAGVKFLFTSTPNKNSLYGEYMPSYGVVSETHDLEKLHALLDDMGVPYLDLLTLLKEQEEPLYFLHDSHWNGRGAALGADAIIAAFGGQSDYFHRDFVPERHDGDLYEMLYPALTDHETAPILSEPLEITHEAGGSRPDSITIITTGSGEGRLLAYRDSFGNNLYPYLADAFSWARFSRSNTYDMTLAESLEADCLLLELVERNLSYLIDYTPSLPAPVRDIQIPENTAGTLTVKAESGSISGLTRFSGTLPEGVDDDSPVYVVAGDTVYEALLGRGAFSAQAPGDSCSIVLFYQNGSLSAYSVNLR